MARINLRPWRDELRAERQREFLGVLGFFAVLGLVYVVGAYMWTNNAIEDQRARNGFLNEKIAEVDKKIKEIKQLRERRQQLVERMEVIQALQGNRPVIVHLFDEVVRTLPDGVYYTDLGSKNSMLAVKGLAESNNRISSLLRRLDTSTWFSQPNLTAVRAAKENAKANSFDMTVKQMGEQAKDQGEG